jgi:hypothetical protein
VKKLIPVPVGEAVRNESAGRKSGQWFCHKTVREVETIS